MKLSPAIAKNLRHLIASVISDAKAYDVPRICKRYGLAEGDSEEAFKSKYKYVQNRMQDLPASDVLKIARKLQEEEANFELGEQLALLDEQDSPEVTELTRKRLAISLNKFSLSGDADLFEFLRRFWPTQRMQYDDRGPFEDFVSRHYVVNGDIDNREFLEKLGFYKCSKHQLFRVLEGITDPLARMNSAEQLEIAELLNRDLSKDGYVLTQAGMVSGSPRFIVRRLTAEGTTPADSEISAVLATVSESGVHDRWQKALKRRKTDPRGAITLARTLLEDVCKGVLTEAGETFADKDDLPVLYRRLSKLLKLAPDDHTEQVFKQILGSCQSVVESIGAIRNKLGDAHSAGPKKAKPQPRHAELAVNLAGAMATFLLQTWQARNDEKGGTA